MAVVDTVRVRLAAHDWTFDLTAADGPADEAADTLTAIDTVSFGWTMPGPLWPAQPEPMKAQVVVNVPDFADAHLQEDLDEVDRLAIELLADGDVVASFYGDVTDYDAIPRLGRPGMTVSAIAVDYTVRLNTVPPLSPAIIWAFSVTDEEIITALWADPATGYGALDSTVVWTSPARNIDPSAIPADAYSTTALVAQLVLQGVDQVDEHRMVLAPMVDPDTGRLMGPDGSTPSGRIFTLDTFGTNHVIDPLSLDPDVIIWAVPGAAVRRDSLRWSNVRSNVVAQVIAQGWGGSASNIAYSDPIVGYTPPRGATTPAVPVNVQDFTEAGTIASYYERHSRFEAWQIDTLDIPASRAALDVPVGLFPNWALGEDDPARAACYSAIVGTDGVDPTRTPNGSDVIVGALTGAAVTITRSRAELSLAIRRILGLDEIPT